MINYYKGEVQETLELFDGQEDLLRVTSITKKGVIFILGLHKMFDNSNPYKDNLVVDVGYVYMTPNPLCLYFIEL
ncbi:hypothetical protein NL50_09425 [Clostridium acetobutylicum]|nr:hypothetical protein NL50_09425 [Clostridium acetobutylicum]